MREPIHQRAALGVFATLLGALLGAGPALAAEETAYGRLLANHVRPGTVSGIDLNLVDYDAVAKDPDYQRALADFASARPGDLATEDERFAFWANAYNLLAIKTIVDRRPIASIKDGGNFLFPIWKKKVGTVAGKEYSLDEIEHGILRAEFDEPRVHFAVVCASLSCPDLRAEPYDGTRLGQQLDDQTALFLANRTKGLRPGKDGTSAEVSSIFKWFGDDFTAAGGVAAFVRGKSDPATARAVAGLTDGGISYLDYDWSLNDTARAK